MVDTDHLKDTPPSILTELMTKMVEVLNKTLAPILTTEIAVVPIEIKLDDTNYVLSSPKLSRCIYQAKTSWDLSTAISLSPQRPIRPFDDGAPITP